MKTVELFAGNMSFSKVAKARGHETFTVDNDKSFNPDLVLNLRMGVWHKPLEDKIQEADIIWMSPPCTTFSMASGNTHWTANREPKTIAATIGKDLLEECLVVARYCESHNKIYFIENPRARARWFLPEDTRKTAWYCQYGDTRAKPTDIWTNLKGWIPKTCHNGNKDCHHESAPRGSKTGTQGLKDAKLRSIIPPLLFEEIFDTYVL